MTQQLNSLTPKELREFQRATAIISKVFGLDGESLDVFFRFMLNAGKVTEQLNSYEKRIESLERQILRETKASDSERAKALYNALNTPVRSFTDEQ